MDNVKGSKAPNVGGRGIDCKPGNDGGGGGCEELFELSDEWFDLTFGELCLREDECNGGDDEEEEFLFRKLDEWWWWCWWCNDGWGERERERFDDV